MAEAEWYYAQDGVRHGPVSLEELKEVARSGKLLPCDLVWQPAFGAEWRKAHEVAELTELFMRSSPEPEEPRAPLREEDLMPKLWGVPGELPSATAAARAAWQRMTDALFHPFNMRRWFGIGFCAWLSQLGNSGFSYNARNGGSATADAAERLAEMKGSFDSALRSLAANWATPKYLAIGGAILAFALIFILLGLWLSSRGKFMFLHRLYNPDEPLGVCWRRSAEEAGWLFAWRAGFMAAWLLTMAGLLALGWRMLAAPYLKGGCAWDMEAMLVPAVAIAGLMMIAGMTFMMISELLDDFVVPVMYWQGIGTRRAWRPALSLCNQRPWGVTCFYLLKGLCGMGFGAAYLLAALGTCCIAAIPMAMPVVGSVMLLPASFFMRGYSVNYMSQWRDELVQG